MTDPSPTDTTPDNFAELPIQPTGSGVADLEIAYERMRVTEDLCSDDAPEGERVAQAGNGQSIGKDRDVAETEAHPT